MAYSEILIMRISTLCKEQGISYYKLEELSGVNLSTIDNIVRSITKNPRIATLHKIAIALGMTLSQFLDFRELNEFSFDE